MTAATTPLAVLQGKVLPVTQYTQGWIEHNTQRGG